MLKSSALMATVTYTYTHILSPGSQNQTLPLRLMSGPSHRTIKSERKAAAESSVYDPSCTVTAAKTYLRRNRAGRDLPLRGMRTSSRRTTFLARPGRCTQIPLRTTARSFCYPNSEEATKAQFRVTSTIDRGHGKRALRSL